MPSGTSAGTTRCRPRRWPIAGPPSSTTQGVSRAAIIASVPGDEASVAAAVERHPARFVGYFMLDPTKEDAESRVVAALERGLRGVCLFPAMQGYSLHDPRVARIVEIAAAFGPADERPGGGSRSGDVRPLRRAVGRRAAEAWPAESRSTSATATRWISTGWPCATAICRSSSLTSAPGCCVKR